MASTDLALPAGVATPALVVSAGERTGVRFLWFFWSVIRNPHTRRAYARAAGDFLSRCAGAGVRSVANHASSRTTRLYV